LTPRLFPGSLGSCIDILVAQSTAGVGWLASASYACSAMVMATTKEGAGPSVVHLLK
jgi:hypothetical protein